MKTKAANTKQLVLGCTTCIENGKHYLAFFANDKLTAILELPKYCLQPYQVGNKIKYKYIKDKFEFQYGAFKIDVLQKHKLLGAKYTIKTNLLLVRQYEAGHKRVTVDYNKNYKFPKITKFPQPGTVAWL